MADVAHAMTCADSRPKQYHDARVPAIVTVVYPPSEGSPEHAMRVCSTPRRGSKLAIELTTDNLDVYGYANPPTHYVR